MSLPFEDARAAVVREIAANLAQPAKETVSLDEALGRALAEDVRADRDQPPFDRVTRDGFAVRSTDVGGVSADAPRDLAVIGEVPAGAAFAGRVGAGECVEIMTGAPLAPGADAVVMVEHTERPGPDRVRIKRSVGTGEN